MSSGRSVKRQSYIRCAECSFQIAEIPCDAAPLSLKLDRFEVHHRGILAYASAWPLPDEWDQRLRVLHVAGILTWELLRHELVFCAHAPQKDGQQRQQHADERTAHHGCGAETLEKPGGVHRVAHEVVRACCHKLLPFFRGHRLAPVAAKLLAGGDE